MHNTAAKSTAQQDAEPQNRTQAWPNDFNLRAEAAEQQEVVRAAKTWHPRQTPALTCSEYDF
ncbi:hypothetical protein A8C75_14575 [Marinobacterium aestuarii]|uniref:Uncharacterized protein n=1 Tax=Marinobacterium aestuarii TaxID=1821621 RepID=A0A1A9F0Q8_9GAMM|nr:hypothetical protein [Marinobacterium aestuarii]ANG63580.1 hypothetical protein A8C75_14575 [Marinobacterium aestuarii]